MELKVKQVTFPEVIEFNFEELKQEITERAAAYMNLVYTDDQIAEAKKDRAALNKFVKALSDERIKVKKECLKPYEDFETKIKELDGIVNGAIKNIDDQVKSFEEKKKAEKLALIQEYWDKVTSPDHPLTLDRVLDAKWLNASTSMKSVQEAINAILAKYAEDIATLQNLPEFSFEAIEVYKSTLNINEAITTGNRLLEMAKRKAEYEAEAEKREETAPEIVAAEIIENPIEEPDEALTDRQWVKFRAHLNVYDAKALKAFFEARNIEFEPIL